MCPHLLVMISEVGTTTSSTFTTKISRNMKILANNFANDDHCMSVAENFPNITLASIYIRNYYILYTHNKDRQEHEKFGQQFGQ